MRVAFHAFAVIAAAFLIGAGIYVTVSYVHLVRHTPPRSRRVAIREAFREGLWVLLVQPWLPLLYVAGRRMGGARQGTPVVLVHGYMQNRVDFLRISRVLARRGLGPLYGFNYAWWRPVVRCVDSLGAFVERVRQETGAPRVDLVGHSLGGLVALEYADGAGRDTVRRIVTIASPHAGIAWRGPVVGASGKELRGGLGFFRSRRHRPLRQPVLSIASTHDNVVHPPSTSELSQRGGTDMTVGNLGHLALLFDAKVARAVADFLAEGDEGGVGRRSTAARKSQPSASGAA